MRRNLPANSRNFCDRAFCPPITGAHVAITSDHGDSSCPGCIIHNMGLRGLILGLLLNTALAVFPQVKVTIDHNTGNSATAEFKFKKVPSPAKNNLAAKAKLKM